MYNKFIDWKYVGKLYEQDQKAQEQERHDREGRMYAAYRARLDKEIKDKSTIFDPCFDLGLILVATPFSLLAGNDFLVPNRLAGFILGIVSLPLLPIGLVVIIPSAILQSLAKTFKRIPQD